MEAPKVLARPPEETRTVEQLQRYFSGDHYGALLKLRERHGDDLDGALAEIGATPFNVETLKAMKTQFHDIFVPQYRSATAALATDPTAFDAAKPTLQGIIAPMSQEMNSLHAALTRLKEDGGLDDEAKGALDLTKDIGKRLATIAANLENPSINVRQEKTGRNKKK